MVTRCTSLLLHSQRSTPLRGGAFAWCSHFVSHFAPNAPTESCRCTNRIPWYHQNPAYTHRILFALTAWLQCITIVLCLCARPLIWCPYNTPSNHCQNDNVLSIDRNKQTYMPWQQCQQDEQETLHLILWNTHLKTWNWLDRFSLFNSLMPADVYICLQTGSSLFKIMACHLFSAKFRP